MGQFKPSSEVVAAFQRDGAVVLRGLLNAPELVTLTDGIERNRREPSPRAVVASEASDPGTFFEDFCNWQQIDEYAQILKNSALPSVAKSLMASNSARIYHDHLLVKTAGTQARTPWHQDQPYYNIDGRQNVSFWIPVDPVAQEATLTFLAGSHDGRWYIPRTFRTGEARWFPEGSLADMPDMSAPAQQARVIGWALEPGDCVAFHMLTLHCAAGSKHLRRVFSARYVGDDATHAPRPWKTSPEFPGLAQTLPAGAELDHPLFPLV